MRPQLPLTEKHCWLCTGVFFHLYSAWKIFSLEPSVLFALILKIIRFLSSSHLYVFEVQYLFYTVKCNTRTPGTDAFIALFFHGSDKIPDESNLSLEGFIWTQSLKVLSTGAGRHWPPKHETTDRIMSVVRKRKPMKDVASSFFLFSFSPWEYSICWVFPTQLA